MPDIYKHGYDNFKKITVLFILQIILGVLPVILLVCYIGFSLYTNAVLGYVFIVVMALAAFLNFYITKRYNALISGFRGEKSLLKSVKKLGEGYTVFANLPVRYKKNRSEIDLLVMCDRFIVIIEVKNHSGYIYGNHKDDYWTQRKIYRDGKTTETLMTSPIKQMRRQRDIIKSILRANDLDQWVDTVLYFSAPSVHLYLDLNDSDNVCSNEKELLEFLRSYKSPKKLDADKLERIRELFRDICENG